jgi:hypothetical protein
MQTTKEIQERLRLLASVKEQELRVTKLLIIRSGKEKAK